MTMTDLTAREVQALAALAGSHPMTSTELAYAVTGSGMSLMPETAAVTLLNLARLGLVELTTAVILGRYRLTARGRSWIAVYTGAA